MTSSLEVYFLRRAQTEGIRAAFQEYQDLRDALNTFVREGSEMEIRIASALLEQIRPLETKLQTMMEK